jgi:hypothetical protein
MNKLDDKKIKSLNETCKSVLIEHNAQYNKNQLNEFFGDMIGDMKRNVRGGISSIGQGNVASGIGQMVAGALAPLSPTARIDSPESSLGTMYNKYVAPHTSEGQAISQYQQGAQAHYDAHVSSVRNHLNSIRGQLNPTDSTHMPLLIALDHFDNGRDSHAMQILGLHEKLQENASLQEQSPSVPNISNLLRSLSRRRQGLLGVIGDVLSSAGDEAIIRQLGIKDLADTIRGQPRAHDLRMGGHNRRKQLGLS